MLVCRGYCLNPSSATHGMWHPTPHHRAPTAHICSARELGLLSRKEFSNNPRDGEYSSDEVTRRPPRRSRRSKSLITLTPPLLDNSAVEAPSARARMFNFILSAHADIGAELLNERARRALRAFIVCESSLRASYFYRSYRR